MTAAARARPTTSRSQLLPLHSSDYKEGGVSGMNTTDGLTAPGFFSRERTIAKPGFNRWLVPPAALAIHLCIGMAYGFSVFWLPLSKAIGITQSVACPKEMPWLEAIVASNCDWKISLLGWTFTLFFVFLGTSA